MVKLTPELLAQAPSALNPIKERQLDLRGEQFWGSKSRRSQTGRKAIKFLLLKILVLPGYVQRLFS